MPPLPFRRWRQERQNHQGAISKFTVKLKGMFRDCWVIVALQVADVEPTDCAIFVQVGVQPNQPGTLVTEARNRHMRDPLPYRISNAPTPENGLTFEYVAELLGNIGSGCGETVPTKLAFDGLIMLVSLFLTITLITVGCWANVFVVKDIIAIKIKINIFIFMLFCYLF